jgi:type IV pilus assembly protein PilC
MVQTFKYRARDRSGKLVIGAVKAGGLEGAIAQLRKKDIYVVGIKPVPNLLKRGLPDFLTRVAVNDLAVFCRQLATMIGAGLPLPGCLHVLSTQTQNIKLRLAIGQVMRLIEGGQCFSGALATRRDVFPDFFVSMVEAGEMGGALGQVLDRLANHFEKEHDVRSKIKSAASYPAFVSLVSLLTLAIMFIFVLPKFSGLLADASAPMPVLTQLLFKVSQLFSQYFWVVLVLPAVLGFLLLKAVRTPGGRERLDTLIIRAPVMGRIVQRIVLSRFCYTMAALVRSGVPLLQALEVVKRVAGNKVVERAVTGAQISVVEGSSLSEPLGASPVFPPMLVHMVRVGEETGSLDVQLEQVAAYFEREADNSVARLGGMLEPVLILFTGGVVGLIVISVMLPMFLIVTSF